MPPVKKIDLLPAELRARLKDALEARGYGGILDVTEDLNDWLSEEGLEITIGRSAVGEYSKLLKDQRECFTIAEELLSGMDIQQETDLYKTLLHMIATTAIQMIRRVRQDGKELPAKDLMSLGRMMKDLTQSSGYREALIEKERERIAQEERTKAASKAEQVMRRAGITSERAEEVKAAILGVQS